MLSIHCYHSKAQHRYFAVQIEENDASIYQTENNEISNFDLKKASDALATNSTSYSISEKAFAKALFLATTLFSKRVAQHRFLIIRSCGNCLDYSILSTLKYDSRLSNRNIIVNSWGDYEMKNEENDEDTSIVGYDDKNFLVYQKKEKKIENDDIFSIKVEHKADLCYRLASKTLGTVLNLNELANQRILDQVTENLLKPSTKYTYQINSCQKFDYVFGDFADFSYNRVIDEE